MSIVVDTDNRQAQKVPMGERRAYVRRELTRLAKRLGPGGRFPTIQDLCLDLGVAKATVDGVVKELRGEGLVCSRRGSGVYVADTVGQTHLGLIFGRDFFGSGGSPFYQMLLERCSRRTEALRERFSYYIGAPSLLVETDGRKVNRDLLAALRQGQLQGLLLVGSRGPEEMEWMHRQGLPLAVLGQCLNREICTVYFDYAALTRMAVEALIQRGCRRLALITPLHPQRREFGRADLESFHATLAQHGLTPRPEWVWDKFGLAPDNRQSWFPPHEEVGYRAARELLAGERPDGIVCLDDMTTRGLLGAFSELGVGLGREIQVATHVNQGAPGFAGFRNRLLMYEMSADEVVNALFSLLDPQLRGEMPAPRQLLVQPQPCSAETHVPGVRP